MAVEPDLIITYNTEDLRILIKLHLFSDSRRGGNSGRTVENDWKSNRKRQGSGGTDHNI